MSLTIILNNFQSHFLIFPIYELSITSLCFRAQCAPPPLDFLGHPFLIRMLPLVTCIQCAEQIVYHPLCTREPELLFQ